MRRAGVGGLARGLPPEQLVLHGGMAGNALGNGLATPFLLIYLHSVRGMPLHTVGLVPLTQYGVAVAAGAAAGPLVDRIGGRAVAATAMLLLAAGFAGYPVVRATWQAFPFATLVGLGTGAFWPGYNTLLARIAPRETRHNLFALQGMVRNLGFGIGGLVGGLVASVSSPRTFTLLFLLNAATYVAFAAALALLRGPSADGGRTETTDPRPGRYRDVLGDRAFVATVAMGTVFAAVGIAQFNSMLPVFARSSVGVKEAEIGLVFLLNTLTIVLAQLPIARALEGRRRMRALGLLGVLWAGCWGGALVATAAPGAPAAFLLFAVGVAFGLGECVLAVVLGPLVADLAPERLRGRYTALWLIAAQLGYGIGPAVGGVLLAASPRLLWAVAAAFCLGAAFAAPAVGRLLPEEVRTTPRAPHVVPPG